MYFQSGSEIAPYTVLIQSQIGGGNAPSEQAWLLSATLITLRSNA
jgi:hypothetical protein